MRRTTALLLNRCIDRLANFCNVSPALFRKDFPWNQFGVRDPSLLMDANGRPVLDADGRFSLFFNARDRAVATGGITSIGIARGRPGAEWIVEPNPVFMDGAYAAQGCALCLAPDHFRMYYSPDTLHGFALASSIDGRNWCRFESKLILEPKSFGIHRMGLPFVRRIRDEWVMVFEGTDNGRFHIYLAHSPDGISWQPGNDGKPLYLPLEGSWDYFGQANPSLYVAEENNGEIRFFILYNGCHMPNGWDLGVLTSTSLQGPWQALPEPVLRRGRNGEWDGGRIEGARLIDEAGSPPAILYFGLPTTDSYAGGNIALASINSTQEASPSLLEAVEKNRAAERTYNDKLAQRYFDVWDNYPIQRFTTEVETRLIDATIPPSSRVIVLGCGGGRELPPLISKDCKITAVDISPQMLAAGRARYPDTDIDWIESDLHRLPSHLEGFEAAVCLGAVFNYLQYPDQFLANVRRCLKPGGNLIMAVINAQHPTEVQARPLLRDGRTRHLYTVSELESLLSAAGFHAFKTTGVRFLVDLLPADWNSAAKEQSPEAQLLNEVLIQEEKLIKHLPPSMGKFILVHASLPTPEIQANAL